MISHHDDKTANKRELEHVIKFSFDLDGQQNQSHGMLTERVELNSKEQLLDFGGQRGHSLDCVRDPYSEVQIKLQYRTKTHGQHACIMKMQIRDRTPQKRDLPDDGAWDHNILPHSEPNGDDQEKQGR